MVGNEKEELSKYKAILNSVKEQDNPSSQVEKQERSDNVVLFFSFDVVNSTAYKTVNYYGWSIVLDRIITEIRNRVKEKITRAEVWRVLGDEVVFIVNICDKESIFEYVEFLYEILVFLCTNIENGDFFRSIDGFSDTMVNLMRIENIISLKSYAWLAAVTDKTTMKNIKDWGYVENMFEIIEDSPNSKFYEFRGVDIDTGFRLGKETREKRLALSFELSYLLSERKEFLKRIHIITYRKLKGVWNNSYYPIIWYYNEERHNGRKFKRSFPFDAVEKDELYVEYFGKKIFSAYMYSDTKNALNKILVDRRLEGKIKQINEIIEKSKNTYKQFINDPKLELHCVAVCYNSDGKILIVQRANRKIHGGKWEFGCAKANSKTNLVETLSEEYKQDFGITISIHTDKDREDIQPIPFAMYQVESNGESHKGVIFLARIISGSVTLNSKKHCNYKFISQNEINSLNQNECVPDIKDTLKKAFEKIESLSKLKH